RRRAADLVVDREPDRRRRARLRRAVDPLPDQRRGQPDRPAAERAPDLPRHGRSPERLPPGRDRQPQRALLPERLRPRASPAAAIARTPTLSMNSVVSPQSADVRRRRTTDG